MSRHTFRRLGFVLALAVCQLSWFVPTASGQEPSPNAPGPNSSAAAPSTGASATAASPDSPPLAGVVPMENDPMSRVVRGGALVGNMTYHAGPVQHTQKIFTIFWAGPSGSFLSGYQTTINQFVQDLNGSPYYATASQYNDTVGYISTGLVYGGTWLDTTNAIPNVNVSYADLLAEVNRAKIANGWTSDANSYFQVYTPSGYLSTISGICGLHWFANPAIGQILYPQAGCFESSPWPNGQVVDAAINVSAHEILETVTDPLGNAWYYVDTSGENGDLCNFNFGARAADGSNATLNGRNYIIQQEWSNAVSGCAMSYSSLGPPTAATLVSPSGYISTNHPTYTWDKVTGASPATWYYLWVENSGTPVIQQWYTAASVCGAATCSVIPAVPAFGGTYTWWVLTWNSYGYGPWSNPLSFVPGFAATTLIAPSGATGTTTPTYTWNKTGASWYYLWVQVTSSGAPVIQTWYTAASVCPTAGGTCAVTPSFAVTPGVSYTWWIETFYNPGGYGPWSSPLNFVAGAPPPTFLITPTGSIGDQTPTYTWDKVSSSTWYYLWVQNAAGTPLIQTWYTSASVCGTSTCSVTPAVALAVGNTHTWWVLTYNPLAYGPWSTSLSFTPTTPTATTLTSPTGSVANTTPTFSWSKVGAATWYYLWVQNAGGTPVITTWYPSDSVCSFSVCSVTPPVSLASGNLHTWWVETWNPIAYGPWSTSLSFTPTDTLPTAATLVNPLSAGTETTPGVTFQWNKVATATWYYLWLDNVATGGVVRTWYPGSSVCGSSLCSLPTPVNLPSGQYNWWIETWSPAAYGPWSTGRSFTVASAPTSIVLTWNEYPGDLDGHLLTPQIGGLYYHVYYGNRGSTTLPPYTFQEADHTSGFGPENMDVAQRFPGTYRYFVNNFAGTPPLAGSGARVKIFNYDTLLTTLTAPASGTGVYWQVCDINGATGALVSCPNTIGGAEPTFADGHPIDAADAKPKPPADKPAATENPATENP